MGIKVKHNGTWLDVYKEADELPLGTVVMWHKSLEATTGTARETGTCTTDTADKLIDSTATFVTNSVAAGDIVHNTTDNTYATVVSVDSETQLTLDWDACPDGNEAYSVYPEPDVQPGWIEFGDNSGSDITISDADSPFNGKTIPDIIGSERFLRARETAGRLQADAFQGHRHLSPFVSYSASNSTVDSNLYVQNDGGSSERVGTTSGSYGAHRYETDDPRTDGTNGTPRTADETRPINISFVPILKIKMSGDVKLATYYSVAGDNFNTLTELTSVEDADEMVIYDNSATVYKKVGIDTLRQLTPPTMIVEDQKPNATGGGSTTSDTVHNRDLNTVVLNEITGASLDTSTGIITLPVGSYEVEFSCPGNRVNRHEAVLWNIDDSSIAIQGTTEFSNPTYDSQTISVGAGRVTIAASKTFRLRHWTLDAYATFGLGVGKNIGSGFLTTDNIFSRVVIKKVS